MREPRRERHDDGADRTGPQPLEDAEQFAGRVVEDQGTAHRGQPQQGADRVGGGEDGRALAGPQQRLRHQRLADATSKEDGDLARGAGFGAHVM